MKSVNFKAAGRLLAVTALLALSAVLWVGCGGDNDNPSGGHTHDWGDWTVTTAATCSAAGVKTRTCKLDASHKETQSIPKLTGAVCETGGGDDNHDSKLVCDNGEAWVSGGSCTSPKNGSDGIEFKLNGDMFGLAYNSYSGVWERFEEFTWRTDGNKLIYAAWSKEKSYTYDVSNGYLTISDSRYKKCSGLTIGNSGGSPTEKWMKKNLDVETEEGSWCYNNSLDSCAKYGRLYTWEAAKAACQLVGKRLPTREDWSALVRATGGAAGTKLKSKSGWSNNGNGTDDYGFSALPGGIRHSSGSGGGFDNVGSDGRWWMATEHSSGEAYRAGMYNDDDGVDSPYEDKLLGFSVRCIEN